MIRSIALFTLLGGLLTPPAVYAQTGEANLSMTRKQGESYDQLLQRANKVAADGLNQRFNRDKSLKWLKLSVFAENAGTMAPLMTVQVSRQDWQSEPNVQRWANVFPYSKTLLGFDSPPATPPRPAAAAAPTPPAPNTAKQPAPGGSPNAQAPAAPDNKKPEKKPAPVFDPYPVPPETPAPLPERLIRDRNPTDAVTDQAPIVP